MYKRRLSPLDVVSPECYALCHPLLPRSDALLEGFSRDPFQLRCRGAFYLVHILKTGPLDDPLEFGEEKNHKEPDQASRGAAPAPRSSSRPETLGYSERCEPARCHGEAATCWHSTSLAS